MLKLENLNIGYAKSLKKNKVILKNINLEAQKGELIAILGENGAGKSTLLRNIAGLQKKINGNIFLADKNLQSFKPKEIAQKIAMVLTEKINVPHLTVHNLLGLARYPYHSWLGKLNEKDREIISWAMKVTETENFAENFVTELSDGEKQKVMIARALVQDTPIILLDEPTAHLDFANKVTIFMLIRKLVEENQKLVIFSTHDLTLALQLASKIWLIPSQHQQIIAGSPEDLVLSGKFEDIFNSKKVSFDNSQGNFRVNIHTRQKIKLIAEDKYFFWTKNALTRIGFEVTDNGSSQITFDKQKTIWTYKFENQQQEFKNLEALIRYLEKNIRL